MRILRPVCGKHVGFCFACIVFPLLFYVFLSLAGMKYPGDIYSLEGGFPITKRTPDELIVLHSGTESSRTLPQQTLVPGRPWLDAVRWMWNGTLAASATLQRNAAMPQCSKLVDGDPEEQSYSKEYMKEFSPATLTAKDYAAYTTNCSHYLHERAFFLNALPEEKAFPLAYSIVLYKDIDLVERLLRAIYRPHNFYCLHVDKKADPSLLEALRSIASCLKNVFVASNPVEVTWGEFSLLEAELVCMRELWRYKKWRYFINLTGQEFPLKTNLQLVQILTALNGSNLVDCTTSRRNKNRWYNNFLPPHGVKPYKGNVHVVINRGFVDYVLHNPVAHDFLSWLQLTDIPDESFFSTLNYNPHLQVPGAYLGPPDTDAHLKPYLARFKNWGHNWLDGLERMNFNWPCYGKRVRTICVFGVGDLPLLTSRKELFANKFYINFEPLTLQCLEDWLYNMTVEEYAGRVFLNVSFYENLDIVKNKVDPQI